MMEYKGYMGRVEFDDEAGIFHGEVVNTRDVVTFQGQSVKELKKAFRDSVDDYLAFCAQRGEEPDKPFSGQFVARIPPELHRKVNLAARVSGKSLNAWVAEQLESAVGCVEIPPAAIASVGPQTKAPMAVRGAIRGLGNWYVDGGLEALEINVDKAESHALPAVEGQRIPIALIVGGGSYNAGLRATRNHRKVWICPDATDATTGRAIKLAHVLRDAGFKKNQQVELEVSGSVVTLGTANT